MLLHDAAEDGLPFQRRPRGSLLQPQEQFARPSSSIPPNSSPIHSAFANRSRNEFCA
jgi:hypothetical protein